MKKVLFIAPIPPPINGQSKASKIVLETLLENFEVEVINLSKTSLKSGVNSLKRFWDIFKIIKNVFITKQNKDILILSLAESFAGNLRDLLIYFICRKHLDKMYVQMLGGAGMKKILEENSWRQKANKFFLSKLAGVIVEGESNAVIFGNVMNISKIHIVPNFADEYLFHSSAEIEDKFKNLEKIQILFLSNLLPGKGYLELADAYIALPTECQNQLEISFVGGFESINDKNEFIAKIKLQTGLKYLGEFVDGDLKRNLYTSSHIFCLPTYYPYEGQPISILEGYATGCAVITTNHSGIPTIFQAKENGYLVDKKSVSSLSNILKKVILEKENLLNFGLKNNKIAVEKYRTVIYKEKLKNIFIPQ